jgi:hypothetical protein
VIVPKANRVLDMATSLNDEARTSEDLVFYPYLQGGENLLGG